MTDAYGLCTCGATESDRRRVRRRAFEADADCVWMTARELVEEEHAEWPDDYYGCYAVDDDKATIDAEPHPLVLVHWDTKEKRAVEPVMGLWVARADMGCMCRAAPTREAAIEALWRVLEAGRE